MKVGSIGLDAKSVMSWIWLAVLTLNGNKIPLLSFHGKRIDNSPEILHKLMTKYKKY